MISTIFLVLYKDENVETYIMYVVQIIKSIIEYLKYQQGSERIQKFDS